MPYIDAKDRPHLDPTGPGRACQDAMTPGELNFQLTALVDGYLAGNLDYQAINDVVGALECAKLEVYRRIAAPYEDLKIELNGDVYVTQVRRSGVRT